MMEGTRVPESAHEIALDHLLHGTALTEPVSLEGVEAALSSFDVPAVRAMFDACILGLATAEELQEVFGVSGDEVAAYTELFFDRTVFHNDFHVIAYIGSVVDEDQRKLLKSAHVKGFREIRFKYAAERHSPPTDQILERMLEGDARQYMEHQSIPFSDPRAKHVLALGKQVLETAQIIAKTPVVKTAGGGGGEAAGETQYVIQSGPLNPTLEELLSKGIQIAH
jgi:hypothetical protein